MNSTLYAESERHRYLDRTPDDPHHRAIVSAVLAAAGAAPGATLLEIGAGRGRYTEMLLDRGFEVIAIEPDAALAAALRRRFDGSDRIRVVEAVLCDEAISECGRFAAMVGFHVLHHFDPATLACLERTLVARTGIGAAFLEPNPLNPLYPVQIALHPAMRFREEQGLWRRTVGPASPCPSLKVAAHLGLLPPGLSRRFGGLVPSSLCSPCWAPWSAYRLIVRSMEPAS